MSKATQTSPADTPKTPWSRLRHEAENLAAPLPPLLVEAERVASTVAPGVHGRRRAGIGETFWQYRRFRAEDSKASVDWRQSARSDHLYVRENEWEAAQSVWLWRDGTPSMNYRSAAAPCTKRERATVLTLALASLLVRGGERVALLGSEDGPVTGRAALRRVAARLTSPGETGDNLPPDQPLPGHARLVLIGDMLAPAEDIAARMAGFGAAGVRGHLVQILDPAEEDLPFRGRTLFEGIEEKINLLVGRAENLRTEYKARLEAHRAVLQDAARRLGWSFHIHRTDRPPQTVLLALYLALSGEDGYAAR